MELQKMSSKYWKFSFTSAIDKHSTHRKNLRNILTTSFVFFLIFLSGCKKPPPTAEAEAPTVIVTKVIQQTIPIYSEYIGQTEASLDVDIRARVAGFLEKRLFIEGTTVKKGDVLYIIDDRPYQVHVNIIKAELERSKARKSKSERDLARIKPLYEQNAASQKDYDEVITAAEEAEANLLIAKASLEEAELELSYTSIESPLTGLIGKSSVDIGALVGPGGEVLLTKVQKTNPIYVRFNMTAVEFLKFRRRAEEEGETTELSSRWQSVAITLPDGTDYQWKGDVYFTDPQVNPQTGSFAVRAVLPNPDLVLQPGQFTRVRLRLGWIYHALLVPQGALQVDQHNFFVYVVNEEGITDRRFVEVEQVWEDKVIVTKGVSAGENVIVEGMQKIRPRMKVSIAEPVSHSQSDETMRP